MNGKRGCSYILLVIGAITTILGLFMPLLVPGLIKNIVRSQTRPTRSQAHTDLFDVWVSPTDNKKWPVPIVAKYWMYDNINPEGVKTGEKPKFNLKGPFIYDQHIMKENIAWPRSGLDGAEETTVSYTYKKWNVYNKDATYARMGLNSTAKDPRLEKLHLVNLINAGYSTLIWSKAAFSTDPFWPYTPNAAIPHTMVPTFTQPNCANPSNAGLKHIEWPEGEQIMGCSKKGLEGGKNYPVAPGATNFTCVGDLEFIQAQASKVSHVYCPTDDSSTKAGVMAMMDPFVEVPSGGYGATLLHPTTDPLFEMFLPASPLLNGATSKNSYSVLRKTAPPTTALTPNNDTVWDAPTIENLGLKDHKTQGEIIQWAGYDKLKWWAGKAQNINATDGSRLHPVIEDDEHSFEVFIDAIYRKMPIKFDKPMTVRGIEARKYTVQFDELFGTDTDYHGLEEADGLLNMTNPVGMIKPAPAPIFVSRPFLNKTGKWKDRIDWSNIKVPPELEDSESYFAYDPLTGSAIKLKQTFQINAFFPKHCDFPKAKYTIQEGSYVALCNNSANFWSVKNMWSENVKDMADSFFAPIFIIQLETELTEPLADKLKSAHGMLNSLPWIGMAIVTAIGIILLAAGVVLWRASRSYGEEGERMNVKQVSYS